jgi:transposase
MGRKSKVSIEEKIRAIEDYFSGERGTTQICYDLQIHHRSFEQWLRKYQLHGKQGLLTLGHNKHYPEELKLKAAKDYCEGQGSIDQICNKYDITAASLLQKWIKKYNGGEPFASHNSQGDRNMINGRKTTYEERVEIVAFCIANNDNYQKAAEEFQVSYQQVYTWVRKYKEQGPGALTDRRGKHKKPEEMNESEKLAAQLKLLEAENMRLKMENDFLKKLDEVERRRAKAGYAKKTDI